MHIDSEKIRDLLSQQLSAWELAQKNYNDLSKVVSKQVSFGNFDIIVQFNPARITSSAAKIDTKSILERKCFLCPANLPAVQKGIDYKNKYQILVNPFPIFKEHFTIPTYEHIDQLIVDKYKDMLDLAELLQEHVLFYNGPKCGASAPDHAHFQAGKKGFLPLEKDVEMAEKEIIRENAELKVYKLNNYLREAILIESPNKKAVADFFGELYKYLEIKEGEKEPMMNIVTWYQPQMYYSVVFPREVHRPSCYFKEGEDNILISPGAVDMGGTMIIPQQKDFEKLTSKHIVEILEEVSINKDAFQNIINLIKSK